MSIALLGALLLLFRPSGHAADGRGPLRLRNQFPAHLMFLTPVPENPDPPDRHEIRLGVSLDYAAVFVDEISNQWQALMDMELGVITLSARWGITRRLSAGLDLPLAMMRDGFLDPFLADFHDTFNLNNYGRAYRPDNTFAHTLSPWNSAWISGRKDRLQIADSALSLSWALFDRFPSRIGPATASLTYTLKLPLGDTTDGYGSGGFDHGLSLSTHTEMGRWHLYATPGFFRLADPDLSGEPISVRNIFSFFIGTEYAVGPDLSLLVQLNFYTSPFRHTDIHQLDTDTMELGIGIAYGLSDRWQLEIGFSEDLSRAAPDFALHTALRFSP